MTKKKRSRKLSVEERIRKALDVRLPKNFKAKEIPLNVKMPENSGKWHIERLDGM